MTMSTRLLAFLAFLIVPCTHATGAPQVADFKTADWELSDGVHVEEIDGRTALTMRSGFARWRGMQFEDGTIELDVRSTGHRSFVYVMFRMESDAEREEFYFRPHKTALPDVIQYTPAYGGASNWQLYHGEGFTAAADFPAEEWVHLRIVVSKTRAAVFVGEVETPQLIVPRLARPSAPGYIALRNFFPVGLPAEGPETNFSNLVVRPGEVDFDFSSTPVEEQSPKGVVEQWLVSDAFAPPEGVVRELPSSTTATDGWRRVDAEPSGLVVLGRHVAVPEGMRRPATLAKITLVSERATTVRLNLGFSDEVSVFLNGRLLVSDNDSYSFNFPRRQGLIGLDQLSVYLPLERGDNELVLAVSEVFGGWGLMGQLEDAAGVSLRVE
jgi:hypothetical protein